MNLKKIVLFSFIPVIIGSVLFFGMESNRTSETRNQLASIAEKLKNKPDALSLVEEIKKFLNKPDLPSDVRDTATIFAAYLLSRGGEYGQASPYFDKILANGNNSIIKDYIDYWHGKTLWTLLKNAGEKDKMKQAAVYFKKVIDFPGSALQKKAYSAFIRAAYYCGDYKSIKLLPLEPMDVLLSGKGKIEAPDVPEILFILGEVYLKTGARDKFIDTMITVWEKYPHSFWADKAEKAIHEAGEGGRVSYPAMSLLQLLDVYDRSFTKNKSTTNAQALLKKLDLVKNAAGGLTKDRVSLLYGKIYATRGSSASKRKSLPYLTAAYESADPEIKTEAAYYLVRDAGEKLNLTSIQQVMQGIDDPKYRDAAFYDRAAYGAGFPFMRKQRYREAAVYYNNIINKQSPVSQYTDQALWRLHWCNYRLKDYSEALKTLEKLGKYENWKEYSAFWTAYIYNRKGDKRTAETLLRKVIQDYGFNYYGILAQEMLKKEYGVALSIFDGRDPFVDFRMPDIEDPVRNKRFQYLKNLGLYEYAVTELETYLKEKGITNENTPETWKPFAAELAKLCFAMGRNLKSNMYFAKAYSEFLSHGASGIPGWFWDMQYPLLYKETIDKYAEKYGLDPVFVYSLIRQESVFEPTIASSAGAIGLMQLMPQTARAVFMSTKFDMGLVHFSTSMLYNPKINIPMGTYHLKHDLFNRIETRIQRKNLVKAGTVSMKNILVIAGYNAGIERSFRWLSEIYSENDQEFIDQVDFSETRLYIKLILKHYFFYTNIIRGKVN